MTTYAGLQLTQADTLTALCADLDVRGASELWRFQPDDAALTACQVYAAESRGLAPPMPNRPAITEVVAAGPEMIARVEHGRTPVAWGYNAGLPVAVFRTVTPSRWPHTLSDKQIETQYRAIRGWERGEPWPLPADWWRAWMPLLEPLQTERRVRFQTPVPRRPLHFSESLVDLIGRTVDLTKRGAQFWGVCPLHDDHQPSLAVHPDRGWWCHSCQRGGRQGAWVNALRERRE